MKSVIPFYFLILIVLLQPPPPHAFGQGIVFNKVLPPDGKKFIGIAHITQDKEGYMWFATQQGLFRYNGYQMISYKDDPVNPSHNLSTSVCAESTRIILGGT